MSSHLPPLPAAKSVAINGKLFDRRIFFRNPNELAQARQELAKSPKYQALCAEAKELNIRIQSLKNTYRKICKNKEPEELKGLSKAYRDLASADEIIRKTNAELSNCLTVLNKDIESCQRKLQTAARETEIEKVRQNLKALQHDRALVKKRCRSRLIHAVERKNNAEAVISQLDRRKAELIASCSADIVQTMCQHKGVSEKIDASIRSTYDIVIADAEKVVALVNSDLNLSDSTVMQILDIDRNYTRGYWSFDSDDDTEFGAISYSTISIEIRANFTATMAELVASVAVAKETSFVDALVELHRLRKNNQLIYFATGSLDRTYRPVRWHPRLVEQQKRGGLLENERTQCADLR